MIQRTIDFSIDNRLLVIMGWLLVVGIGVRSLGDLPIDAVPDVTNIQVQVLTNSPGLAPEEVEQFITFPVETAMSGLPRVEEIRSVSRFGLSVVTVVFEEDVDIYWARQLVGERLSDARGQIPAGYGEPEMGPISTGLGEIYQFEVRGDPMCEPGETDTELCFTPMELRTILDWHVNYRLRSVPGIVEVNSFGGELKTYQLTIDPSRLVAYGLTTGEVLDALAHNNRNVGGGYIAHQGEQYLIRGEGLAESLSDIGNIVVSNDAQGTPVYASDLGKVEFAPMIRQGAVTRDGRGEAVVGIVMMLMGENARAVVERVKEKIVQIEATLPAGVSIDTFYDRTELVQRTIHTVAKNLIEGGALVVVVLLLLLGNLRGGLIVASAIPLSMLVALTAMKQAGLSGNLMSLGAIDFGLIVDGSVVMIENIVRVLHQRRDDTNTTHIEKVRAAAHEVARPVVFAVGIIMIVYLPILGLHGVEGKMFRPMALTVVFALAGSLVCAQGAPGSSPREVPDLDFTALSFGLGFGQTTPRDLRVGEDHGRDGGGLEAADRPHSILSYPHLKSLASSLRCQRRACAWWIGIVAAAVNYVGLFLCSGVDVMVPRWNRTWGRLLQRAACCLPPGRLR